MNPNMRRGWRRLVLRAASMVGWRWGTWFMANAVHRRILAFVVAFVVGFGLAFLRTPSAFAACGTAHACINDPAETATALVYHQTTGMSPEWVEPNTGEEWEVRSVWASIFPPCDEYSETATVAVDFGTCATGWAPCSKSTTSHINDIQVCDLDSCGTGSHSWAYKLYADVDTALFLYGTWYYLSRVEFTTTSVDNGRTVNTGLCNLGASKTPTSQSFSVTDYYPFVCTYTCGAATGPSLTLTYQ